MSMKISNINNTYYSKKTVNGVSDRKHLTAENTVSFKSAMQQEPNRKQQLQNIVSYIAALGIFIGGVANLSTKIESKKEDADLNSDVSSCVEMYTEENKTEPDLEMEIPEQMPVESATDILDSNPDLKKEYDKIMQALGTFSEQLGEDALPLIKDRVSKLGNGKVDVIDVLKILWIESNGKIYDDENPNEILKSSSDAYGAFQITKDTQDYLNFYFGLEGTDNELDVENPYDNLDACIYNLRFLHNKRSNDIEEGKELPTGNNLKVAVAWSYHDGAWANNISLYGQDYIEKYNQLSKIDEYPQVIEYILNCEN